MTERYREVVAVEQTIGRQHASLRAFTRAHEHPEVLAHGSRVHVKAFLVEWSQRLRPASVSVEFTALRQFWKWALDEGEATGSPLAWMRPPHVPEDRLTDTVFPILSDAGYAVANDERWKSAVQTLGNPFALYVRFDLRQLRYRCQRGIGLTPAGSRPRRAGPSSGRAAHCGSGAGAS